MHPSQRNSPISLALAQATYARAREQLLAAEEAYARALLALRRAQASGEGAAPPPRERHFLCGHAGMVRTAEGGEEVHSWCPACRIRQAGSPAPFTEERLLLVREPQQDDPD